MPAGNDDVLLTQKIREGDADAFEIVFLKYYEPMCKYIWKFVRTDDLAEEIVQEVFATIWERRTNLDPSEHLRGLLYESARNEAFDYIKHQKIVDRYLMEARANRQVSYTTVYHHDADHQILRNDVQAAMNDLPPKARQIFELNREEGLTYKEIANYLDISVKTVEYQMRKVLGILRDRLSKYFELLILICLWLNT